MKEYVKPEVIEVSDMMETVGLSSGDTPGRDSHVEIRWTNHDSGSYSVLHGKVYPGKGICSGCFTLKLSPSVVERSIVDFDPSRDRRFSYGKVYDGVDIKGIKVTFHLDGTGPNSDGEGFEFMIDHLYFKPGPFSEATPGDARKRDDDCGDRVTEGAYCLPFDFHDDRCTPRFGIDQGVRDADAQGYDRAFYVAWNS